MRNLLPARVGLAALLVAAGAWGADAGPLPPGHPPVGGTPAAAASGAGPAMPPGHPEVPPGHPSMGVDDDGDDPHGHGHGSTGMPGMPSIPADGSKEDPSVPAGTIQVAILDPDGRPIPRAPVTLGIMQTSVAKGESRRRVVKEAGENGVVRFTELETGSGVAYRVSVARDQGTFALTPFQLPATAGMRGQLHVYPITHDMTQAQVGAQAIVYVELKDDRIQVQQVLTVMNLGKTAWVPHGIVMKLPDGFTALSAQQSMSDTGIDPVENVGARLRGTFGPGRHVVEYRWQLPYNEESAVDIDVELMPRVVVARVLAPASQQMKLSVDGFPAAEPMVDPQGQRLLQTERALMKREDPEIRKLHVSLRDLPTPGPARKWVTAAAMLLVCGALFWGVQSSRRGFSPARGSRKEERLALLAELEELERARRSGDVGPKTYERARREIVDAIARTLGARESAPQTDA